MKLKEGITLIALILTIIIMLILLGATIGTISTNFIGKTKDVSIQKSLEMVDTAIKLYKTEKITTGMMETVDNNTLIQNGILKEYTIEETLRPIAVVEDYLKLRISEEFGGGYKNIQSSETGYISTLNELENVCAIDLTDGTLYYLNKGKIYSLSGKNEIANNFERENANLEEWTFNESTKTLTAYNGDLTTVRGKQNVGELIIPNYYNGIRVSDIKGSLFNGNTNLTKITISKGIETIGEAAFNGCTSMTGDLIIPDTVTTIGRYAFGDCRALDGTLKLSTNLISIGGGAFGNCKNLKGNIVLPATLTSLGNMPGAFRGCASLESLTIEEGCTASFLDANNNGGAFQGCTSLKGKIIIPSTFGNIGTYAFYGCTGIEKIVIKNAECKIADSSETFYKGIKLGGYTGSTAELYATKYSRTFEEIQ